MGVAFGPGVDTVHEDEDDDDEDEEVKDDDEEPLHIAKLSWSVHCVVFFLSDGVVSVVFDFLLE